MKPSVYVETSIVSYLTARPSRDVRVIAWQDYTSTWWRTAPQKYDLYSSELVRREVRRGDPNAARRRLECVAHIAELQMTDAVQSLAELLLGEKAVPKPAWVDALHISYAAVHRINYLATWNCRHINNPVTRPIVRRLCEGNGYAFPEICTPYELLGEEPVL